MPFILIKGRFKPLVGNPDGDSMRFLVEDKSLWDKLEGMRVLLRTNSETKDIAQLRFEGIDAIENAVTKPLSPDARKNTFFPSRDSADPPVTIVTSTSIPLT